MKIWMIIAAASLALAACGPSADERAAVEAKAAQDAATREFVEKAKVETARDLRDPSSAQFRDLAISSIDNRLVLCGEINAKNAYGAYTGYTGFYAVEVVGAGDINGDVSEDGWATEKAMRCIAAWDERKNADDPGSASVERDLASIGCGTRDYDFMFWAGRSAFCAKATPYTEGA